MPHKLEKFYSSFGGVDTRSNKLIADPRTFRKGSKNFRYNFQDEIQNANGWQHKTEDTPVTFVDIFEYKYRDVNTGESKSQVLAVGVDGNLYRKVQHTLKWIATGAATSYSFFYDEVGDKFKMTVNGVGSVNISESMTLNQLKTALNVLTGITVDIVDNDGASVTSSKLAYLLDVRIEDNFNLNSSWFWEVVPCSGIPFPNAVNQPSNYEGISSVSINNAIYMTDGWFIMKYDGYSVYRSGMPKFSRDLGINGVTFFDYTTGSLTANSNYRYAFQFGFVDPSGAETLGKVTEVDYVQVALPSGRQAIEIPVYPLGNADVTNDCFPVYSCAVNGNQTLSGTGFKTLTVDAGHNIKVGMCVRLTVSNLGFPGTNKGISFGYLEVTGVTATTITFNKTISGLTLLQSGTFTTYCAMALNNTSTQLADVFPDELVLNGCYVPDEVKGIFTEPQVYDSETLGLTQAWVPQILYGAFVRIFRSKGGVVDSLYRLIDAPISHQNFYKILDQLADTDLLNGVVGSLTTLPIDYAAGDEIPRACKYLTKWQNSIVQAGRPINEAEILNKPYPWYFAPPPPATGNKWNLSIPYPPWVYQENNLCDEQSIYWTDPITPEGFPQDGLHEFAIDTEYNDAIKGIAPNKDALFAIKERSTGILTGDLGTNDIVLEVLEDDIGLASHKTLQQTKGALIWLDPIKGFYACVAGRLPQHIGYPICDYMQINAEKLDYSKAAAMNARAIGMYICVVGSTWFVYDYSDTQNGSRNCWYIWERFSSKSALFTAESEILLLDEKVWKMKVTNTRFDMTDHKSAIEMDARQAWWNGGLPTIDKMFERLWTNSIQGGFTLSIDQYANYLDDRIASIDVGFKEAPKKTVKDYAKAAIPKLSAISFGLRNAEKNKLVRIQGFEIEYAPDFDPSEPRR